MKIAVFWFRRDLRLSDNTALSKALGSGLSVLPVFIFDTNILEELTRIDPRVTFIHRTLTNIHNKLLEFSSSLACFKGDPQEIWKKVISMYDVKEVYFNRDYEPYARDRDQKIFEFLREKGIRCHSYKDQVIFEENDILKKDGNPYTVFTPYRKQWLERFNPELLKIRTDLPFNNFLKTKHRLPSLSDIGFAESGIPVRNFRLDILDEYAATRNYPGLDATTLLGPHLRFGTLSIRWLISQLNDMHSVFQGELIWREFFMQILYHFPTLVDHNFHSKYDGIRWRNNEMEFERWCKGETGYPMVDAGMRQLNTTGYMHNRLRMIVASFLCKHLLIDWRWGEAYFAERLIDYELSSNNGNWQWAAGTGCDAAPWFRIFNPEEQLRKFDRDLMYVKKWIPEYGTPDYPAPMVDHRQARTRAIEQYTMGLEL